MEGKVAKIVRIARAGARVHGCFRDAFTSDAAGLGGGEREREGRGGPYRPRVDLRGAPCIFTAAL